MLRLFGRKLLLLLLAVPLLHWVGYTYATAFDAAIRQSRTYGSLAQRAITPHPPYSEYFRQVLDGDLGLVANEPVLSLIAEPLRNSVILIALALLLVVLVGPLLGWLSISRRTRRIRPVALMVLTGGASLPGFLFGSLALAIIIYGSLLIPGAGTFLPIGGYGLDIHLLLPVLTLASRPALYVARLTAGMLEHELQQDYITVARSRGYAWWRLLVLHATPNIVAPVLIALGQALRLLVSGLIIVEPLFRWPGLGQLVVQVLGIRMDGRAAGTFYANPVLLATAAVLFGIFLLLADLVASMVAAWADPRMTQRAQPA